MDKIVFSNTGLIHLIASCIALLTGTLVLVTKKGTQLHKRVGYLYALSMLVLIVTAFGIYRLFGGFGIFHVAALISFGTLLGGMVPVMRRKPSSWIALHYSFMYWSVMGLYGAFVAEMLTRIPRTPFFGMLGVAVFAVMLTANLAFRKYKPKWATQFGHTRSGVKEVM